MLVLTRHPDRVINLEILEAEANSIFGTCALTDSGIPRLLQVTLNLIRMTGRLHLETTVSAFEGTQAYRTARLSSCLERMSRLQGPHIMNWWTVSP